MGLGVAFGSEAAGLLHLHNLTAFRKLPSLEFGKVRPISDTPPTFPAPTLRNGHLSTPGSQRNPAGFSDL